MKIKVLWPARIDQRLFLKLIDLDRYATSRKKQGKENNSMSGGIECSMGCYCAHHSLPYFSFSFHHDARIIIVHLTLHLW